MNLEAGCTGASAIRSLAAEILFFAALASKLLQQARLAPLNQSPVKRGSAGWLFAWVLFFVDGAFVTSGI
jgi:hypothetical protein